MEPKVFEHDGVHLRVDHVEQLDEPIRAGTTGSRHLLTTVEVPTTDEPLHRAFFTESAHLSDRPIGS
ncbi:hypothetical protein [Saccharothrix sp. Mg75]|uniref:hypothetical protein n=1 Tax=Saccharothrix sp. Mg75 TaxID=3445357 RepID=UPI003EEBD9B9